MDKDSADVAVQLLWHVEQVLGPVSTATSVVAGDDDHSILLHNFKAVIAEYRRDLLAASSPAPAVAEASNPIEQVIYDYQISMGLSPEDAAADAQGIAAAIRASGGEG